MENLRNFKTFELRTFQKTSNKSRTDFNITNRYGTKTKNCSGFMRVDQFMVAGSLLSPKILISPK
jgi:hypothetical protein